MQRWPICPSSSAFRGRRHSVPCLEVSAHSQYYAQSDYPHGIDVTLFVSLDSSMQVQYRNGAQKRDTYNVAHNFVSEHSNHGVAVHLAVHDDRTAVETSLPAPINELSTAGHDDMWFLTATYGMCMVVCPSGSLS